MTFKTDAPFWGGVEVACLHFLRSCVTSESSALSRLCYSLVKEQRRLACPFVFLLCLFNHSETLEIHGRSPNRLKSSAFH